MLVEQRHYDEAETALNRVLAADPAFDPAFATLGAVLLETGRPVEAIEALQKAISLAPEHANYASVLATAFARLYQFKNAELALSTRGPSTPPMPSSACSSQGGSMATTNSLSPPSTTRRSWMAIRTTRWRWATCLQPSSNWPIGRPRRPSSPLSCLSRRRRRDLSRPISQSLRGDADQRRSRRLLQGGESTRTVEGGSRWGGQGGQPRRLLQRQDPCRLVSADYHAHATWYLICELIELTIAQGSRSSASPMGRPTRARCGSGYLPPSIASSISPIARRRR